MPNQEIDDDVSITKDTSDLRYPISNQTEIGNWLIFERKEYKKVDLFANPHLDDAKDARKIILPLPPQLEKNYNSNWDEENLGIWGNTWKDAKGSIVNTALNAVNNPGSVGSVIEDMYDGGWDNAGKIASMAGKLGIDAAKTFATDMVVNSNFFRSAGSFSGVARNPYKAMLYSTPSFRNFRFEYKMMAKNYQEAVAIRDIIKQFHVGAAPDFQAALNNNDLYKYPDLFQLNITDDRFLLKFAPAVCTNINVDYHSEGFPSYIGGPNGEKIPSSVRLGLEFREVSVLTRKDYEDSGF